MLFNQSSKDLFIVVSVLYSFDFYVLGDIALMSKKPFTRTEHMSCVYHSRTKGEGCGNVKSINPPPPPCTIFTDRST